MVADMQRLKPVGAMSGRHLHSVAGEMQSQRVSEQEEGAPGCKAMFSMEDGEKGASFSE